MLLYMWLGDNFELLNLDQFNYIILDCHPTFSTTVKSALTVSHVVLSPITPDEDGYNAKFNLEERIREFDKNAYDYQIRKTYVTGKLYYIANKIAVNEKLPTNF